MTEDWLEARLREIHDKWHNIKIEINIRKHNKTIEKAHKGKGKAEEPGGSRAAQRVWGRGGVADKWMRIEYQQGLKKLKANKFESKAEKEEFEKFVAGLTPEELQMVSDKEFR